MASTSGLQRRRVAGSTSSSTDAPQSPAGTADRTIISENGVRVAIDPLDLKDNDDKKHPQLTLMEEVLLLGLKDKQVSQPANVGKCLNVRIRSRRVATR
jgi:Golgi phosphoprotein 3